MVKFCYHCGGDISLFSATPPTHSPPPQLETVPEQPDECSEEDVAAPAPQPKKGKKSIVEIPTEEDVQVERRVVYKKKLSERQKAHLAKLNEQKRQKKAAAAETKAQKAPRAPRATVSQTSEPRELVFF